MGMQPGKNRKRQGISCRTPLPCMVPAVEPGEEVPTYEVTPTKELDDCGAICEQCENEVCKKGPAVRSSAVWNKRRRTMLYRITE